MDSMMSLNIFNKAVCVDCLFVFVVIICSQYKYKLWPVTCDTTSCSPTTTISLTPFAFPHYWLFVTALVFVNICRQWRCDTYPSGHPVPSFFVKIL